MVSIRAGSFKSTNVGEVPLGNLTHAMENHSFQWDFM
jgi:hypothetical protein